MQKSVTNYSSVIFTISFLEAEHQIEHILSEKGINCPLPELNVYGKEYSIETIYRHKSKIKGNNNGTVFYLLFDFFIK